MKSTIDYYNENARKYINDTAEVEFKKVQDSFLKFLPSCANILDFGCGSGRDTKYFLEQGYHVDAIDGSKELCNLVSQRLEIPVKHMLFQDLSVTNIYDGIWACASILHLAKDELAKVLRRMEHALKEDGIIYTSFKYGTFEGWKEERYFTYFTEVTFAKFLKQIPNLQIMQQWVTTDVRVNRGEEQWMNLILMKKNQD